MKLVVVRECDAEDRVGWRQVIGCSHPMKGTDQRRRVKRERGHRKKILQTIDLVLSLFSEKYEMLFIIGALLTFSHFL